MKKFIFALCFFCFNIFNYSQQNIECSLDYEVSDEFALYGGKYKPSVNSPGQFLRALVVFVEFSSDSSFVEN
ncbi:MAG: hypothetical protein ACM3O3_00040 [Syntrophothermus sp.]